MKISERQHNFLMDRLFNHRPGTPREFEDFIIQVNANILFRKLYTLSKKRASKLINNLLTGEFKEVKEEIEGLLKLKETHYK